MRSSRWNRSLAVGLLTTMGMVFAVGISSAQTLTWDASGLNPTAPTDGSGNWNTTTDAKWSTGAVDVAWLSDHVAVVGSGSGAAGTLTVNDPSGTVSASGIDFHFPGSGSYTVAASGGNTLTLANAATINVAGGVTPTISAPIAGSAGLKAVFADASGVLTLSGNNTYAGETVIDGGGTLKYTTSNVMTGGLAFGVPAVNPFSTVASALDLTSANLTVGNLDVRTDTTSVNMTTLGAGRTLTVENTSTTSTFVGVNVSGQNTSGSRTFYTITGEGGRVVINHTGTGANMVVGRPRTNADTGGDPQATFDMSGISSYTESNGAGNGELQIGGGNVLGVMRLANTPSNATTGPVNSITVNQVRVGDSGVSGASGNNNGGLSVLALGSGTAEAPATNTIRTNSLIIGTVKGQGIVNFQGSTGSVVITGKEGGTSTTDITMSNSSSATTSSRATLDLAGHMATVQAGTVSLARAAGGTAATANTGFGVINFDTGTFGISTSLQLVGQTTTANNIATGVSGTFTLGGPNPDSAATGVLNVNGQFLMVNRLSTTSTTPMNATLNINGGTANINTPISIVDNSPAAARTPVINLQGGVLDMKGNSIGDATLPITLNAISGTLQNLDELNGGGALTKMGPGALTLAGANSYSGSTIVQAGQLNVNGAFLSDTAMVQVDSGALMNLNFVGQDIVSSLVLEGVTVANGTWGSPTSAAVNKSALFLGSGILNVGAAPAILIGDYDGNGVVDARDYIVWREAVVAGQTTLTNRDPSNMGVVGPADFNSWKGNFGKTGPGSGGGTVLVGAVPEPATAAMLLVALAGVAGVGTRGRRAC